METPAPKISVLMTVYNAERFLAPAIESVLAQTFRDFELVILDDCSQDGSWGIIEAFAARDPRIRALRNERNLGGCGNLNQGLGLLRGEYIARHDNDDWSYPDRFEKQAAFLDAHPEVGMVGGAMEVVDARGKLIGRRTYHRSDAAIRQRIFRYSPFAHPLVMVRRSALERAGGHYDPQFAPADDYELWFRIGRVAQLANLPDTLLRYRILPGSITSRSTRKMEETAIAVRNRYRKDPSYRFTWCDQLYHWTHLLSVGLLPAQLKIRLYNFFRNERVPLAAEQNVVLVTGASAGLGAAIARHLAKRGHRVYGTAREDGPAETDGVHFIRLDITSDQDVERAAREIMEREGRVDVLVNNAGITLSGPTLDFSPEDFRKLLDTNAVGAFRLIRAIPRKPDLIINITSMNGFFVFPNFGIYSASKFAAEALSLALRYELAPATRVVSVAPGGLAAESRKPAPHKTAREKFPVLGWLLPLTRQEDVARRIERIIRRRRSPSRVIIGRDAWIVYLMQKYLPATLFEAIVGALWRKR